MEQEQTSEVATTRSAGIRYGVISGIIGVFYFVGLAVAGVDMQGPAQYLGILVTIAMLFLAHKYYKDNGDGFMTYGQGIGIAFWMGLVSSIISSIFTFVYVSFIDTNFIENIKNVQMEKMQEQGMSDAQVEQAMQFSAFFFTPTAMLLMGLIMGVIITVIVGLIVTIFTQKRDPQATI
jgi:hypothetical protein